MQKKLLALSAFALFGACANLLSAQTFQDKEWSYEEKTNTLTIPKKEALKKDPKLGYDITIVMDYYPVKPEGKPTETTSRHSIANPNLLLPDDTKVLPFLLNGQPFTGKLKGIHIKSQKPILEIPYKDGYANGMFKAADSTEKLHVLRTSMAESQAEANKRRDAKKKR